MADHFTAGRALIEFDAHTNLLAEKLEHRKIDLSGYDITTLKQNHPIVSKAPLSKVWKQCREHRESFLEKLSKELTNRLPLMIAATWLRTNKRSKQSIKHRKYARFENIAAREFSNIDRLSEWDVLSLASRHVLPKLLDLIAEGEHPSSAAERVSAEQRKWAHRGIEEVLPDLPGQAGDEWLNLPDQAYAAWAKTTRLWIEVLEGICTAHHGETFALFHEDQLPLPTYVLHHLFPCARIRTTTFTWLAGRIPAIFRLFLQERKVGLIGLEVDHEHPHVYTDKRPALFLKNLLTWHGFPELAKQVETVASDPARKPPADTSNINTYFSGFGYGLGDNGLIRADCNYAANTARSDRRLRHGWRSEIDDEPDEPDEPTISAGDLPAEIVSLLERGDAVELLSAIQLHVRREQLATVRQAVRKAGGLEQDIQSALSNAWWIFGGEFVGEAVRRRLVETIELDIPLLQPDGVLHIVELKRSDVRTVRPHRNGLIVTAVVQEAVGQAMNYLTLLDEHRTDLLNEFGIDTRRASATVVVGYPDFQRDLTVSRIHETLRIFNSHLSRVEVITYQQLLDRAERVLDLVGNPDGAPASAADTPSGS
ncbi:Shedu anti-phage system protein SduA domain-containing protein [Amycolatopsis umgeniensis]|uniref:Shedu protein SduA C-terminal domain-containing protein n=1 Tax=Amycolatopsis umgeniensis TaxID=336628 RepID=A0A841B9I7_9PSEU|nr:Shedu anti-phage system protein SduA domain-containing protein [Amycolatopsis umgeniensis]MBB5856686.1 hypothetical protein [Amycolatopsis umgeniensis]